MNCHVSAELADAREHVFEAALGDTPINDLQPTLVDFYLLKQFIGIEILKWNLVYELTIEVSQLQSIRQQILYEF